mgnify:CR=1 FL=1
MYMPVLCNRYKAYTKFLIFKHVNICMIVQKLEYTVLLVYYSLPPGV